MPTYLRFTNFVTFQLPTYVTNPAGQKIQTGVDNTCTIPCVFLYVENTFEWTPVVQKEDMVEFVIGDELEPTYSHILTNLVDRYGDVIEPGPMEIVGIKKYAGFQGMKHHYRLKARKLRNC